VSLVDVDAAVDADVVGLRLLQPNVMCTTAHDGNADVTAAT